MFVITNQESESVWIDNFCNICYFDVFQLIEFHSVIVLNKMYYYYYPLSWTAKELRDCDDCDMFSFHIYVNQFQKQHYLV
jgi:hypothetical protein